MNILHIISSNGIYGAEAVLLNLLEQVKKTNAHQVQLVCLRSKDKNEPDIYFEAQKRGIEAQVYFCKSKVDREVIESIETLIAKEKIDIIHAHGYKGNFYGLRVSEKSDTPIVTTLHGWTGENWKVRLYDRFDKSNVRRMDHAICVSPKIEEQVKATHMSSEKITFIPNGIDAQKYDPSVISCSLRGQLGLQGPIVVGTVGRLSSEKGHTFLLSAFKDVTEAYDEVRLLIVGDGSLKKDLEAQCVQLGIRDSVIFAGERDDMPEVYNSMDVFVLPSLTEGIPIALLEAMSMKLAVVATNVGGVPFVLDDTVGRVVESKEPRVLAEAISFLVEKRALREELGVKARARVVEKFSIEQMVARYNSVYRTVLIHRGDKIEVG